MFEEGIINYDGELVSFTEQGIRMVGEMYIRAKHGEEIESLEQEFGLNGGTKGSEDHHIEWKILMAMGDLSGLFAKIDEVEEIQELLDKVEDEYLYGENDGTDGF